MSSAGEALWTAQRTADYLGVPVQTLYQWRYKRVGPPSHRVGRHIRYIPAQVRAWVAEQQ